MVKHLDITVRGKVQGVFFRASTKAVADQLGVRGTVKNNPDGSVSIEAEADEATMGMFLDFCHEGPENAQVEEVLTTEGPLKNYRNFEVLKRGLF
ncbi:acylphosphatase [Mucilaginibacter yixingensis]|uniref:acylphosphatase n=1 Tax=Mucilaginibacter yixingensis TaxID=1295612 RepID=A0A2T5JCH4_9SPHI|nr:acylphosphatase [Mucilaginibacter yixingensis]PTQ99468.1 acylphosphatase [Mucilaginibacter yixingensis]